MIGRQLEVLHSEVVEGDPATDPIQAGGVAAGVLVWRTSSRCDSGQCVEVAQFDGGMGVRDNTLHDSPILHYDAKSWENEVGNLPTAAQLRAAHDIGALAL